MRGGGNLGFIFYVLYWLCILTRDLLVVLLCVLSFHRRVAASRTGL